MQNPTEVHQAAAGPLLRAILEARRQTRALVRADRFAETVEALVAEARSLEPSAVFGASPVGHSIAGAMVLRAGDLELWEPGEAGTVLLVDGFVASVAGLEIAAGQARSVGATAIDALVLGCVTRQRDRLSARGIRHVVSPRAQLRAAA